MNSIHKRKQIEEMVNLIFRSFFCHSNQQTPIRHTYTGEYTVHLIEREQGIHIPIVTYKELIKERLIINQREMA